VFTVANKKGENEKKTVEDMLNRFRIIFSEVIIIDDLFNEPLPARWGLLCKLV
jgi:hypothetical protein